jgi:hypothetical protein
MPRNSRARSARGARFDKTDPAVDTAGAADERPDQPYAIGPLAPGSQSAWDSQLGRDRRGVRKPKRAKKRPATGKVAKTGGKAAKRAARGAKRKRARSTSARAR